MTNKEKSEANALPSLSRVMGYIAVKNLQAEDKVPILARLGYGDAEIATITGLTRNKVAKARARRDGEGWGLA